jgi:hypothetical protein
MQADPIQEWRRLTEHYRQMCDEELRELAFDFTDLTETAQQVLRGELRSRGLGDPQAASNAPRISRFSGSNPPDSVFASSAALCASADAATANAEELVAQERIRRLPLCECGDWKQAWQICAMLTTEDIESWIQDARADPEDSLLYSPEVGPPSALFAPRAFRVLVASHQLAEAREVAAQPIPREIAEASEMNVPEFKSPKCPACGAEDPTLEAVDPENAWRCEQCGEEWAEPAGSANAAP